MEVYKADWEARKGWYAGPWNSDLQVALGYANAGIDEPHLHHELTEIYMVARGTSSMRVELQTVELEAGDVLVVEPGEAHTFLSSSEDYFHFVLHLPALPSDRARADKVLVPRSRLQLPIPSKSDE